MRLLKYMLLLHLLLGCWVFSAPTSPGGEDMFPHAADTTKTDPGTSSDSDSIAGQSSLRHRLLNSLVGPYLFFTLTVAFVIALQWTPLWPLLLAMLLRLPRLASDVLRPFCWPKKDDLPADPESLQLPVAQLNGSCAVMHDSDGTVPDSDPDTAYRLAVRSALFGPGSESSPCSYDLTTVERYRRVLMLEDNMALFAELFPEH